MRENRTCGSEGGEAQSLPYPYPVSPLLLFPLSFSLPLSLSFPLSFPPTTSRRSCAHDGVLSAR